jgi:hypothetical protein
MSRKKKLVNAAKVLGGLGAAYVAHELANPTTIDLGPPLRRDEEPAPVAAPAASSPAPRPAVRNRLQDIREDETMARSRSYGQGPANAYKRLQEASAAGAYASPIYSRGEEKDDQIPAGDLGQFFKKGGVVSASRRADGIAQRGKTRGKMV